MKSIRGKRALVTGAASGIGREIARQLALEGAHVYLLDIDETGLGEVVRDAQVCGVEAVADRCDLTQPGQITAAISALLSRWGGVDILVNNAGVAYYGPTDKMTVAQWDWVLGVNLLAPIQITRELLPTLLARPDAHILNVCSIAGLIAGPRTSAYHVSKFGLVGLTESLRAEYGRRGLGVTALCPGPVRTKLYSSAAAGKKRPVPVPPAWLCVSAERVGMAAVRAIRRNDRLVLMTPVAHLLFNAKRFAPGFIDWLNHVGRRRKQRSNADGHLLPFEPGTLPAPAEAEQPVRRAA